MDKIVIDGGRRLRGEVRISGAKNAALPILCSAILTGGTNTFKNVPVLYDIRTMGKLLANLGCELMGERTVTVGAGRLSNFEAPYELVKTMRASVLVLGPLVARYGRA